MALQVILKIYANEWKIDKFKSKFDTSLSAHRLQEYSVQYMHLL